MKKITIDESRCCPKCGKVENQINKGKNRSGTRRSRCFPRKLEPLKAVVEVFVEAYNAFGMAKMKFRQYRDPNARELPFSVLDFL